MGALNHPTNMLALFSLATLLGLTLVLPPNVALSALQQWERLRIKARPHDKWWVNFVRATTNGRWMR